MLGAESDHDGVGPDLLALDGRPKVRRVQVLDATLAHGDPMPRQRGQRAGAVHEGCLADDLPCLTEAHKEVRPPVDEDDLDVRGQAAQCDRGGDAAEASPEDQHTSHDDLPAR